MLRYAIRTEQVSRILRTMTSLLNVPAVFFDMHDVKLEEFGVRPNSAYCAALRLSGEFNALCEVCDRKYIAMARERRKPLVYRCHNNLTEGVIPLFDERGNFLGSIVFGQIRMKGQRPKVRGSAQLQELYRTLPVYTRADVDNILSLLSYFAQYMIQNHLVRHRGAPWAETLKEYIAANLGARLSVARLAKEAGVSKSYVSHYFRDEVGMTPARYVRGERMKRARELLLRGRRIKEVAYELGFCDEFHFSKVFRREFGISPSSCSAQ
jgi:AraC-like DNA-binding protein/ligand-binding sensor protein